MLNSLIGSGSDNPYRIGKIRANLLFGTSLSPVRVEVVQDSLRRLISEEKVLPADLKKRSAYYLTPTGVKESGELVERAEDLFQPALKRLLENTDHLFSYDLGTAVCRTFMCECFARFGAEIARTVTGELTTTSLMKSADVEAAFEAATAGKTLSDEAADSLRTRCRDFLKSHEVQDVRLKFYLTQGFYFAQLLGLPGASFNPLVEQAFANSVLYLDTNVLLVGLLARDAGAELFKEMVSISKRIGITLRVTRATINEARRVAADRTVTLHRLIDAVPKEIIGRAGDQFITAFLDARESNPDLLPEDFLKPFDSLSDLLPKLWGIEIDERIEDEMIAGRDLSGIGIILQEAALRVRKFEKSEAILAHDVGHCALVLDERATNPRTWFLTRDRSLAQAAVKLREHNQQPFCFPSRISAKSLPIPQLRRTRNAICRCFLRTYPGTSIPKRGSVLR